MAKTKISEFDVDPALNTDINSINIAEGCAPSGINNAIRQLMSDLKEFQTGAGGDPFNGAVNGTVGATTPNTGAFTSLTDSGNLTFTGTGNRITGDFSNATEENKVSFQSSTTNASTIIHAIPNGTGNSTSFRTLNNSDPTNASFCDIRITGTTDARLTSSRFGTGTYLPLTMYTGGSERLRIDTSGNVGIGTSTPGSTLGIAWSSNKGIYLSDGTVTGIIYNTAGNSMSVGTTTNHPFAFYTNNTERMRIDSSGNLLVGTTSNITGGKFAVQASTNNDVGEWRVGTNGYGVAMYNASNTRVGTISINASSTTYSTSSDYRLKENIAPMTGALGVVQQLKPVTYTWKADGSAGQGFIAHELQEVVPDCVTGEKDAVETYIDEEGVEQTRPVYQGIDTSFLVATLTAAIQEQQAIITDLKARIETLENK